MPEWKTEIRQRLANLKLEMYFPHSQSMQRTMTLVLRTASDPLSMTGAIRSEIRDLDPDLPVARIQTMERVLADAIARPRFNTLLLGIFATVALALATVGIYGVMSYSVIQRTREIGIRVALGAETKDVLRLVIGQGMVLTLIGVAVGLVAACGLTRLVENLLFGVSATDPLMFASIAVLLTAVALVACFVPARRATKVDPMIVLRAE